MKVEAARLEGRELILTLSAPAEARKTVYRFKAGNYELKREQQKRSLDANAYCWALCTQIASAVGIEKEEVYRRAIMEGNECVMSVIPAEDLEQFKRSWESRGIGWRVQIVDDAGAGTVTLYAYYGSSVYDTAAMSRLIDSLVQEARALDIETLSERELSLLKEAWV